MKLQSIMKWFEMQKVRQVPSKDFFAFGMGNYLILYTQTAVLNGSVSLLGRGPQPLLCKLACLFRTRPIRCQRSVIRQRADARPIFVVSV